ncbi:MAG: hypothetical protein E7678_07610 [Ruminococcaceae bacterium]|nr:hypothetical protein [Oscillospiraceae bacterium]
MSGQVKTPKSVEEMRQAATANVPCTDVDDSLLSDDASSIDNALKRNSEDTYKKIALQIVNTSSQQLKDQNTSKNNLKTIFTWFFIAFIAIQYLVLVSLLFIKAFVATLNLSDTVIIAYITSVFVETLGAVAVMIKYAFDSKQEVNILSILNGVISNYQKFK